MVSAEASCDLCLKEPLKSTERARIYTTTCTAAGISYKLTDLGNKLDSIGSDVVGVQVPSTTRLVCKSCKGLIERTHQLHVDLMRNKEVLRSRLEDARDRELCGAIGSHKQGSKRLASPSFKGTGVSPASKKQHRPLVSAHSRRTLYPLLGPEGQVREAPVMDTALHLPSRQTLPSCAMAPSETGTDDLFKQQPIHGRELSQVCQIIETEVLHLCSSSSFQSVLRQSSKESLMAFNWSTIISEWQHEAPTILAVLKAIVGPNRTRNVKKGVSLESRYPALCAAGAILLKERNQQMSLIHHVIGLLLFHGGISKAVSHFWVA